MNAPSTRGTAFSIVACPSRGTSFLSRGGPRPSPCVCRPVGPARGVVRAKAQGGKPGKRQSGSGSGGEGGGASGKGFGAVPETPAPAKRKANRLEIMPPVDTRPLVDVEEDEFVPRGPTMRKNFQERGLMEPDNGPDAGVLPQVVADRMIRRIAGFAGVPLGGLFVFFGAYFVAKYKFDISVIPVVVAYTTLGCIGSAGVGITYGIMSSSWDPDVDGTALGFKEAKVNIVRAKDGLLTALSKERQDEARSKDMKEVNEWRKEMKAEKEKLKAENERKKAEKEKLKRGK